ncbi:helix-turn-helix transcriptional regulator [Paenibacillus roseipurpureus]|uniref:AraC family transcriptional regulator n=1 Tax=Paenibacillus roseopurpureus TaxID=2918901 RepID=A0AA96RK77_9BACL|nr:AraC family transcriptional regulator [Paenibacillus sp. MBLB1832]WNR44059.1 AraC family transcriptional regulator [Paenibacillus sp. MBLB1832]
MIKLRSVFVDEPDPHWHKLKSPIPGHILFLVIQGSFTYIIGNETYRLMKGDILYMPYGVVREGIQMDGELHQKYTILFDLHPNQNLPILMQHQTVHIKTNNFEYLKQRFSILVQQWLGRLPYFQMMCEVIAQELLIAVNRESDVARYPSKKKAHVQILQKYIADHYRQHLGIEELANTIQRTPNYVTTIFKEVMGMSPVAYLHQVRISAAKELLLHTKMSVGEVADYLGFYDTSHFHRVFRKHTGQPPSTLLVELT